MSMPETEESRRALLLALLRERFGRSARLCTASVDSDPDSTLGCLRHADTPR